MRRGAFSRFINGLQAPALQAILSNRVTIIYISVFAFMLAAAAVVPSVLTPANILSTFRQAGILGVVALGQFFVIMGGAWRKDVGVDLSVGMTLFLITIAFGHINKVVHSDIITTFLCLLLGATIGLINGIMIVKGNISPFIATMATSLVAQGIAWIMSITMGMTAPPYLVFLGSGKIGFIPMAFICFIILAIILWLISRYSTFGIRIYAKSSNPKALQLLGVNLGLYTVITYVISGLLSAFAGLLYLGFLVHPSMRYVDVFTFDSIAAVILGGTEFVGGIGSILGIIPAAIFMRFLYNFVLAFKVPEATRRIMQGVIIIAVIAVYVIQSRRLRR